MECLPTFEVPDFAGPGVVIVMLFVPLTVSGELALMGVLTGMWQPPSFSVSLHSPLRFLSRRLRNRTGCHMEKYCSEWEKQVSAA